MSSYSSSSGVSKAVRLKFKCLRIDAHDKGDFNLWNRQEKNDKLGKECRQLSSPLFTIDLSTGQHDGCVRSHNKHNEEQLPSSLMCHPDCCCNDKYGATTPGQGQPLNALDSNMTIFFIRWGIILTLEDMMPYQTDTFTDTKFHYAIELDRTTQQLLL